MSNLQIEYEKAEKLETENQIEQAINNYHQIISSGDNSEEAAKIKEQAIYHVGKIYGKMGQVHEISRLVKDIRPFFDSISKAKTAKIVKTLIDLVADIPDSTQLQIDLCKESIEWAKQTKRNFLRQRIESRLAALYLSSRNFQGALELISNLVREVKKLDDKLLLVEIQLIESRIHHALKNLPKSRAALTAARTSANAIYCPPSLQTQLDLQSGILHADEKDYKTAYSYFFEAFEGYSNMGDENSENAIGALKYMLLCKIMLNTPEDVDAIISGKTALKYSGRGIDSMKEIAHAQRKRSLQDFEHAKIYYKKELTSDIVIEAHLNELYDTLLEQNLLRILEPFSVIEINHVATLMEMPVQIIEAKLSQMILDKKLLGILDQGAGHLIIFESSPEDETYKSALGIFETMSLVVDSLFEKANKLT